MTTPDLQTYRSQLQCSFGQLEECFDDCINDALRQLSAQGIADYLDGASLICKIGRGFEPVLVYLEEMPGIAAKLGEPMLNIISKAVWRMSRSPNGKAILPFMQSLPEASRRLPSIEQLQHYMDAVFEMMDKTTGSIHGFHTTIPSPGLPNLLNNMPYLLSQLSIAGLKNWMDYGVRNYKTHPDRQIDYFTLQSADSRAVLQRERHGTLFADSERKLDLYLRGLWTDPEHLVPYSEGFDELRKPIPYYDALGIRIPDVYDDFILPSPASGRGIEGEGLAATSPLSNSLPPGGRESNRLPAVGIVVKGIDRYRAALAHIAAHRRWTQAIIADNFSPFQRVAIEILEDSRVEYLAMQRYPGLRKIFLALHPAPGEDDCDAQQESCIRHRLTLLSRAILDPAHSYQNQNIKEFSERFFALMQNGESSTKEIADLAIAFIARTRQQTDQSPKVRFENTVVSYRDDNRHMWRFIEEGDEEEAFDEHRKHQEEKLESSGLPPRHYPEWDYQTKTFKPDWVSLYESLHPSGNAADIDKLLAKHKQLAKRLKQILDLLKPQQYTRVRYQEEGSELDLDVAIRSLIDYKSGAQPDPRINMSHRHDGRDIAVLLLLDLSASLNDKPEGCDQTILQLSQEAVSLLAWTIDQLGDPFAIAGFHSDTRHNVRYYHIKGYSEQWGDEVKSRIAAMDAGYSTRIGAAIRHATHYLAAQKADKKLMLILTDGEPADIDVEDKAYLIHDTKRAIDELSSHGIHSYCISLDKKADSYIQDIFGKSGYTVIDHVDKLPEKLPLLFAALTV